MKGNAIIPKQVDRWTNEYGCPIHTCPDCGVFLSVRYNSCPECDKIIDWSRVGKEVKE